VTIVDLDTSMVADEDIRALNGQVLVPKGEQLTDPCWNVFAALWRQSESSSL